MTNLWDVPEDDDPNASAAEARLRQSYGINPEQAAQIDALARRAKVPLAAAQTQTDLLKAQTAAADNKRALMNAPATRAFIAADQGNADLTHDHVAQVSNLEPRWTVAGAAAKTMKGVGGTIGGAFLQASSSIWGLIEASAEAPRMLPEPDFAKEVRAQIAADARKQRQYGQQVAQDITPKTGTWWGDALVQGTQSTVQSGIGLAASVAMRNPTPALAGMAAFTAGGEYGKARDEGVSPGRAAVYAAGQGAFEALTEMIPTGVLLKALETGQGPLKGFAKTLLAELPGEQVATLLQDMNQWVTLNPDKSVGEFLRERPQAAAETALATLSATGGSVATGYAAQAVMNRVVERDAAAEQAGVASKAFDALVKDTTALPLRERSPERFKALMDTMGEGVDVHVNAGVLTKYLQSLDPEAAATIVEATGIGDQIAAATPEADIVIPASDYLTFVAPEGHSFLQKDIKLGPAALSLNEAEAHKAERDQLLADAAAQALDLGTEQAQAEDPVERVRQHFYDQAKAIGVPEDQARANAAVQAAYYAQRAARNTTYQNAWDAYAEANISMSGRGVTTAGPGGVGGGGDTFALQQVPPEVAKRLNYPTKMPTDPLFAEAVAGTPAAELTPDGVRIRLVRYQKPEQHGATSVRTGVFYLPKGSSNERWYRKPQPGQHYGGSDKVEGDTLLRRPLFVKGATGGKAPEAAFETIRGKGSYKKLEQDIMHVVGGLPVLKRDGLAEEAVHELLDRYGADTDTTYEIIQNSTKGNQMRYALQENIIAHVVRAAGYDSVVGYSKGKNGASISEVFDVREDEYPTPQGDFSLHRDFYQDTFEQSAKGQVSFSEQGALIELFKSRNASTLIHEGAGHIWLENLARDAADPNATPEVRADLEMVKAWWRDNVAQAVKESGLPEERLRAAIDAFGGTPGLTAEQNNPKIEYHLSTEPNLEIGKTFAEQKRSNSAAGVRGGEGNIYSTKTPAWWDAQLAFEEVDEPPNHVYLVEVDEPADFDVMSAQGHQTISEPAKVRVVAKLGESNPDQPFDIGRFEWLRERWEKQAAFEQGGQARTGGPSGKQLKRMLEKSKEKELRGLIDQTGNLHVWDAAEATHYDKAKELGIPYDVENADNRVWVELDGDYPIVSLAEGLTPPAVYLKDENVFFKDYNDYVTATEFNARRFEQGGRTKTLNEDVEAIRPFHEMFARAAERYFMEGKAPTPALRGPFAKFRQWLVGIYKDFTALRVPMTDDMRGVFDRLIAGQETMAEAIVEQRLQPFFPDAATAGMTDAEYAAYLKTIQTADEAAEDRLLGKLMSDIRRKYTEAWKTERAALVEEFQAQVNDTPEMRALSLLESGEARLSRDAVQDILGDRQEGALYRRQRPYVFDDGVHPDVVAEQAGMSSGQALVEALLAMKEEHDALRDLGDKRTVRVARAEALADAEMLARHGDILNDGTIGEEAVAALHDARRSEAMAAEVRALVRKAGATTLIWSEQEMRAWAERRIGALPLDKIRPHVYSAAEAKAGRDALKALVKDDFQAALDAKFRQLLNAHLYRVARDARDGIEKGKSLFDQIAHARNGAISKSRNMDMVGAARQIIAAYGYEAAANDADYMAKVAAYDPELYADLRDTVAAALAGARDIDTLKLDEFNSLHEVVAQLWRMSRTSRQMEIEFQTLEVEDIANDLADSLGDVAPRANTHAPTNVEHALRIVAGFRAALRRVEAWVQGVDGGNKGPWRTYVWQPVSEAATQFRVAKADYMTRFMELLEPIQGSLKRGKIEAPELAYTFGFANSGVGKGELLHALLHTGNESNKRKLLLGRGWAVERADGTLDTTAWDQFLDRMHAEGVITEADWQFAQSVWDLLEDMKPAAQKAHRAVFGRYFEEVTANPVVTPFGTFRGGYVPAITDTFLVQEQALNAQADAITDANDASMFPSPNRGFTKARVEYNKPLLLDLGLLPGHIDKVLKFSYMTAPVRDVLRLLKEKGLSAKLEAFDAAVVPDLLLPWLNRAAKQIVELPTRGNAGRGFDNFFRALRHRTGMGIMIANVSNTLQQLTGWAPAALKVRKRSLTRALWQVTRDPKGLAAAIRTMSPYMATRTTQTVQEASGRIERLLMDPTKFQKVSDFSQRHAYVMQSITQNLVDMVTWSAAFEESLERGEDLPEAVRSADAVIRQTQGSLAPEDVSRFEVGPPALRVFTQFYSYFNVQGNLWATEFKNSKTLTRSAYVYIMGIAAPAILADAIRRAFGEGWDDDDDDGYLDTFLDVFFGSQFRYMAGAIPIAGQVIASMANQFNDKPFDDKLVPAPAISTIEQVRNLPKDVWLATTEGKRQKAAVRETATLLTLLTGVPLFNVAARPLGYLADINEGKVEPTDPVDFARGLATGAASNESRVQ